MIEYKIQACMRTAKQCPPPRDGRIDSGALKICKNHIFTILKPPEFPSKRIVALTFIPDALTSYKPNQTRNTLEIDSYNLHDKVVM